MKVKIGNILKWKSYTFTPGEIRDLPDEDAKKLLAAGLATLPPSSLEEGAGSVPSSAGQPAPSSSSSSGNGGAEEKGDLTENSAQGVLRQSCLQATSASPPIDELVADSRLLVWLHQHGFRQMSDKPALSKIVQVGNNFVRLIVDFKHNRWGNRYAYVLDQETGEWKPADEYRDTTELMEYKKYRDAIRSEQNLEVRKEIRMVEKEVSQGLVTVEPQEVLVMVEKRDEEQIMRELVGEVLKTYVYRFEVGGRQVVNISYAGVKEAARRRGNIHVTQVEVKEINGEKILAKAEVYDLQNNFRIWGVAVQPKKMKLKTGEEVEDPFAYQKAVSKAIRNGLRACIPEKLIAELINRWLQEYENK